MKIKLIPKTRKYAILKYKDEDSVNQIIINQTYYVLSSDQSKNYSFITKIIDKNKINNKIKNKIHIKDETYSGIPILEVDKNLSGILSKNDTVELHPYNIPEAQQITLGISKSNLAITPGDWTATLKDLLENEIFDLGSSFKAPINIDGKGIMIIRGNILRSTPKLPIIVGSTTKILLEKHPDEFLKEEKNKMEIQKINRTNEIKSNLLQKIVSNLKNSDLVEYTQSLDVIFDSSSPHALDNAIKGLFTTYKVYKESVKDMNKKSYSSSRSFIIYNQSKLSEMVEYQISAKKGHGTILLKVYAKNGIRAEDNAKKFKSDIRKLHDGLKKKRSKKEIKNRIKSLVLLKGAEMAEIGEVQMPLAKLYGEIVQDYPDWDISMKKFVRFIKKMAKKGLISEIQKLKTGFYMINFHPLELTQDPSKLIKFARAKGVLSKEEIMGELNWTEYRTDEALDFLVERKIAKKEKSYRKGTIYYFTGI